MGQQQYDYIILGAGCAGLSLLYRIMEDPYFLDKKILVIDRNLKKTNDRTWCYWEKESGIFDSIVIKKWERVNFSSKQYEAVLDLKPFIYKMIRGIDYYDFIISKAKQYSNIEWLETEVLSIESDKNYANVILSSANIRGQFVFNSTIRDKEKQIASTHNYQLLQHFKGRVIETTVPCFDSSVATLMDFRVDQGKGVSFFYIMPFTATKALVEYTLFSEQVEADEVYDFALDKYLKEKLGIVNYNLLEEEFGIIPMTNQHYALQDGRVVQLGIAGGQVKGSTGYAFQFIQKRTKEIVDALKNGESNFASTSFKQKKGRFYDSVLLQILQRKKLQGSEIFTDIFSKNHTARVLRFLDNDTTIWEDLSLMQTVPIRVFLPAALRELVYGISRFCHKWLKG